MNRRAVAKALAAAAGTAAAVAAWEHQRRVDVRRVEDDPVHDFLSRRMDGRVQSVVSHDGTRLHVETYGSQDAPSIVLIHGWTCTNQFWTHQIRALGDDFHVIAYDQRGHGRSDPAADDDYGIDAFGDDLQAVLEQVVPEGRRPVLAGHSLGGMTIVAWAGRHADHVAGRVCAAALVNTGMGDLVTESLVVRAPAGLNTLKQVIGRAALSASAPMPKGPTPLTTRAIGYAVLGPKASPATVAFAEQLVLEARRDARAGVGRTISRLDLYESIASLTVPTVVLYGEHDRLTPPPNSRRLAESLPELVELVEIPGSGHMSPLEAPEDVTARIRELGRRELLAQT